MAEFHKKKKEQDLNESISKDKLRGNSLLSTF